MKNTKLVLGISLMIQSVAFLVVAMLLWGKKKSLAKAFAAVSAAGGVAGAFCLVAAGKEYKNGGSDGFDGCCECDGEYFDGDDFDDDDIICNFEDTDLYEENEDDDAKEDADK